MMPAGRKLDLLALSMAAMIELTYGTGSKIELELENDALVTVCDAPRGRPLNDVATELQAALNTPRDFPALSQAAVPGDRVVLALDDSVPQAATCVAQTIAVLLEAGVRASEITILTTAGRASTAETLAALPAEIHGAVKTQVHNPRDRERLSYLASATDASPIYINRAIHDADLVVSIGALHLPHTLGYHGIYSGIFPAFSDSRTIARFRSPKATRAEEQDRLREQANEVGWLLGARFTIQVIPGARDHVLHVLAGDQDAVLAAGGELCRAAWSFEVPNRVGLVVAAIEGDVSQQTWENVGRALGAAERVLDEGGDVVICSRLNQPLGPGLERLIGADDLNVALREIAREQPIDGLPAAQLGHALERGRVYLLSDLRDERMEELGIYPLDAEHVSRVASRYSSCIVLANAQYAQAWPRAESLPDKPRPRKSRI